VSGENENYQTGDVICRLLNLSLPEFKKLVSSGVIPKEGADKFSLTKVVPAYIKYISDTDNRPISQTKLAAHLGMSDRNLRDVLKDKLKIDHRITPLSEVRLKYIEYIRGQAAGHSDGSENNLLEIRANKEKTEWRLKEIELSEKLGELIPAADTSSMFDQLVIAFRAAMLVLGDNLKTTIDAAYGIDVDLELINEPIDDALQRLSSFEADAGEDSNGGSEESCSASEDDDDGVG
jgi:terminase small subunit / prophage DNA-packing protein